MQNINRRANLKKEIKVDPRIIENQAITLSADLLSLVNEYNYFTNTVQYSPKAQYVVSSVNSEKMVKFGARRYECVKFENIATLNLESINYIHFHTLKFDNIQNLITTNLLLNKIDTLVLRNLNIKVDKLTELIFKLQPKKLVLHGIIVANSCDSYFPTIDFNKYGIEEIEFDSLDYIDHALSQRNPDAATLSLLEKDCDFFDRINTPDRNLIYKHKSTIVQKEIRSSTRGRGLKTLELTNCFNEWVLKHANLYEVLKLKRTEGFKRISEFTSLVIVELVDYPITEQFVQNMPRTVRALVFTDSRFVNENTLYLFLNKCMTQFTSVTFKNCSILSSFREKLERAKTTCKIRFIN